MSTTQHCRRGVWFFPAETSEANRLRFRVAGDRTRAVTNRLVARAPLIAQILVDTCFQPYTSQFEQLQDELRYL